MKLKINGNGFKDLDNPSIWYSSNNNEVIQWLSEGNIPEPEFTEEELAQQELQVKLQEAKFLLDSTQFKFGEDYDLKNTPEWLELKAKRQEAREFIRLNK